MHFDTYQDVSREYAFYPNAGENIEYPTIGLAGETGEVCEKVKKSIRDETGMSPDELKKELGDVLWYVSQLASEAGLDLNDIALANIQKLENRSKNGTLGGSGDNR